MKAALSELKDLVQSLDLDMALQMLKELNLSPAVHVVSQSREHSMLPQRYARLQCLLTRGMWGDLKYSSFRGGVLGCLILGTLLGGCLGDEVTRHVYARRRVAGSRESCHSSDAFRRKGVTHKSVH